MDYSLVIYDRGCLRAGEEWVERNLIPVAAVAVSVSVLQVGEDSSSPNLKYCILNLFHDRLYLFLNVYFNACFFFSS